MERSISCTGCAGAKGTEREEVLLLGDDIVNQTIPLILCVRKKMSKEITALRWAIWTMQRCFICAPADCRERKLRRMVARARIDALNELVADEAVQKQVQEFMNQKR